MEDQEQQALNDIPADTSMVLTEGLHRLFLAQRCNPTCHCCGNTVKIGEFFALVSVEYREQRFDEMICAYCTKEKLQKLRSRETREWVQRGRGYSRPSRR